MGKHINIPVFIPHLGCNNNCVFCNQRSITGKMHEVTVEEVRSIIDEQLRFSCTKEVEIAFFGGSFTGIPIKQQEEYLLVAKEYVDSKKVSKIRLSTRPDYINEDILSKLASYGVNTIELGAQSMCDDVLLASKRGHRAEDIYKASHLIKEKGFKLGLQMMIGLPLDTHEKSIYTANEIVKLSADCTRIYPTAVLKNTELYDMYKTKKYTPWTVEQAVRTAKEALKIFLKSNVEVLRIGLQSGETLGADFAAGAYHPAIGEMVYSALYCDRFEEYILANPKPSYKITTNKIEASKAVGQKRSNIKYLEEKFKTQITVYVTDGKGTDIE